MLLWHVRKQNSGFTLIEMLVTVIVVGVIAAVASPNLLGMLNRYRVDEAMRQIEGGLREAQKQAIRNGRQCTVNINATGLSNPATNGCLLSNRTVDNLVTLNSNRGASITFSGKGNITLAPKPVFVTYMSNGTNRQDCIVIETSLGSMRTGEYTGDPAVTLGNNASDNCQ